MLKINLIRKPRPQPPIMPRPALLLAVSVMLLLAACGKSNTDGPSSVGLSATATVTSPAASADLQSSCAYYRGTMTTSTDGTAVCKYNVGSLSGSSTGFYSGSCNIGGSSQATVSSNISVYNGDTITMQTSKNVTVYIASGFQSGVQNVNGSAKFLATGTGVLMLGITIPNGCSLSSGLSTYGINSLQVDRCLDSANQSHPCN
jgi:hypothetical protein